MFKATFPLLARATTTKKKKKKRERFLSRPNWKEAKDDPDGGRRTRVLFFLGVNGAPFSGKGCKFEILGAQSGKSVSAGPV